MTTRRTTSGKPANDARQSEQLMTVAQLAAHWQLSPRTIRRMITQGLPVLRFGRAVRIHPKNVAKLDSNLRSRGKTQTPMNTERALVPEPAARPIQPKTIRDQPYDSNQQTNPSRCCG